MLWCSKEHGNVTVLLSTHKHMFKLLDKKMIAILRLNFWGLTGLMALIATVAAYKYIILDDHCR